MSQKQNTKAELPERNDPNLNWAMYNPEKANPRTIPAEKPTLPERTFAEHPWPTSDKSEAIDVWRSAYTKALGEREAYKAQAAQLAEALRGLMSNDFANDAISKRDAYRQSAIDALAAYEAAR